MRGEVPARRWRSAHVAGIEADLGAEPNQCVAVPDVLALAEVGRISAARGGRLPGSRPCYWNPLDYLVWNGDKYKPLDSARLPSEVHTPKVCFRHCPPRGGTRTRQRPDGDQVVDVPGRRHARRSFEVDATGAGGRRGVG